MEQTAATQLRLSDQRWRGSQSAGTARHRALTRLYERRQAVDNLIDALERYQQDLGGIRPIPCQVSGLSVVEMSS